MSLRPDQKLSPILALVGVAFSLLFIRLYYLQAIKGEYYLKRSESNFIQERVIKHNRGKILDKNNRILVDNRLSYDLFVTFALLPDSLKSLRTIAGPLKLKKEEIRSLNQEIVLQAKARIEDEILLMIDGDLKSCRELNAIVRSKLIPGVNIEENEIRKRCTVSIDSLEFPSHSLAFNRVRDLLKMSESEFQDYWNKANKKAQGLARFKPVPLMSDIGFDAYARIENAISLGLLAGVTVVPAKRRRYIYDDLATHVLGFLNQVSVEELRENKGNYRSGDYVGRKGIEASFEQVLRGEDGIESLVVDAKGRRFSEEWEEELLGPNRIKEPEAGMNIKLSIDAELQRTAQNIFGGISGSVIMMDVNTGFIKVMASFPSFDPNIIVSADNAKQLKELFNDKNRPFRNKAVQDHYPPGSTFKAVAAIA
ncbi:MAG TPA: penicillin-binding transpeptidase domain-containing protein, partial [Myxococcota bacterium]|nr:penicillin-binding transpeptidase domain-containing protein [Myxococcota bacterium]